MSSKILPPSHHTTDTDPNYVPLRRLYGWQFADPMIVLVLLCSFIAFVTLEWQMAATLFMLAILASVIGFAQEYETAEWPPMHRIAEDHRRYILDFVWSGSAIVSLAVANYLLFLYRNGFDPSNLVRPDIVVPFALSVVYLTVALCLFAHTIHLRAKGVIFSRETLTNHRLLAALATGLFALVMIVHNTDLQRFFGTAPVGIGDWLWAIVAAAIFIGLHALREHANTHHTREAVIKLHHKESKKR